MLDGGEGCTAEQNCTTAGGKTPAPPVAVDMRLAYAWLIWSFFFSSRRRHTRFDCDWSSDVCSSDLCCHNSPARANPASPERHSERFADEDGGVGITARSVGTRSSRACVSVLESTNGEIGRASCRERV